MVIFYHNTGFGKGGFRFSSSSSSAKEEEGLWRLAEAYFSIRRYCVGSTFLMLGW